MPLVKATLKTALAAIFNANITSPTAEQTAQINAMADGITNAIDDYIKSATVTSAPALVAGSVAVTGTIVNTIS